MEYLSNIFSFDERTDNEMSAVDFKESNTSIFKEYGIERDILIEIFGLERTYNKANAKRAILDILEDGWSIDIEAKIKLLLKESLQEDSFYDFFKRVYTLKKIKHWNNISLLMREVFYFKWIEFLKAKNVKNIQPVCQSIAVGQELPEGEVERAKHLARHMFENWGHTFALVGALGLQYFYDFPLKSDIVEIFLRKDGCYRELEEYCKDNEYSLLMEQSKVASKYGIYELEINAEQRRLIFKEVYPYSENEGKLLTLTQNTIMAYSMRVARKTRRNIPVLCFEHQCMLMLELYLHRKEDIELLYQLCLLTNYENRYKKEIYPFLKSLGVEHLDYIVRQYSHPFIEKSALIREFIKALRPFHEEKDISSRIACMMHSSADIDEGFIDMSHLNENEVKYIVNLLELNHQD